MNIIRIAAILLLLALIAGISFAMGGKPKMSKKIYATFETSLGNFTCMLYPESAPKTVENFIGLAKGDKQWTDPKTDKKTKEPLYKDLVFHRVIPDFMIQGGDPIGNGTGGPGYKFEDEIDDILTFSNPGTLAMANSGPDTNGSQFFITVAATPWLHGKHTIFGRVVEGQEIVETISKVKKDQRDRPLEPVILKKIEIIEK